MSEPGLSVPELSHRGSWCQSNPHWAVTRALPLAVVLALASVIGGCGVTPPPVGKYFVRTHPVHAANYFRYALETHQWEAAYGCLTAEVRDQISQFRFKMAALSVSHPEYSVLIREYIYDSIIEDWDVDLEAGTAVLETRYEQGDILAHEKLYLVLTDEVWYVDLQSTLAYWMQ